MENGDWTRMLDERQQKTLEACCDYAEDPYGDIGHTLKILVADMATMLNAYEGAIKLPRHDLVRLLALRGKSS